MYYVHSVSTCIKSVEMILPTGRYFLWIFHPGEWRSRLHEGCLLHRHRRFSLAKLASHTLIKMNRIDSLEMGRCMDQLKSYLIVDVSHGTHTNWSKRCWWWVLKYWFYTSSLYLIYSSRHWIHCWQAAFLLTSHSSPAMSTWRQFLGNDMAWQEFVFWFKKNLR